MPPRRKTTQRRTAASTKSRVRAIKSLEQFNAALEKAGTKKIVIAQFFQTSMWACKQLRPIFTRYSVLPAFKNAIFIEIDIDENEDVGSAADVKRIPTYQCYFDGQLVDSYVGTAPSDMRLLIERNVKEYSSSLGIPLWQKAFLGLAAAVGASAAWYLSTQQRTSGEDLAETAREQILDIKQRIVTAQGRLKNLEKANRGKQAKVQRKLIEQLNAQRRALERTQQAAEAKTQASSSQKSTSQKVEKNTGGLGKMSYDDIARIRYKKQHGDVLYSDEEDVLEAVFNHN